MKSISKIYHIVPYFPPHLGGMENYVKLITQKLRYKGHEVNVLTSDIGSNLENYEKELYVKRFSALEIAHTPIIFSLFYELLKLPKKSLIHLHIAQAFIPETIFLISKFKKMNYVAQVHIDVGPSGKLGFLLPLYKRFFLKHVLRSANRVIALNNSQKENLIKKYNLVSKKVVVIPNGISSDFMFQRKITQKKITRLLFVGRFSIQKNILLLIESIPLLKENVELHLVGSGELETVFKKRVQKMKISNIFFHGKKQGEDLKFFYKSCDIFILPSEREAFPLTLLEAMSSGMPIIANDLPETNEILGDSGMIMHTTTPENIASSIDYLISNPKLRELYGKRASNRAKEFSWDNTVHKIENLYREIL